MAGKPGAASGQGASGQGASGRGAGSFALDGASVIGIVGAGTMGRGIAQVAALAGHEVRLADLSAAAADAAIAQIGAELGARVAKGRIDGAARDAALARIRPAGSLDALAGASLVIETVPEDAAEKRRVLHALAGIVGADALLATNTSSLSITALARDLVAPERFLGLHFFNPVPAMALVEVISGVDTAPAAAEAAAALMQRWDKQPVAVGDTPGFIVNRVNRPLHLESLRIVEDGTTDPATLDALLVDCAGFKMGPFAVMDLVGLDVSLDVSASLYAALFQDARFRPSFLERIKVDAGRLGRKSGRGWFDYGPGAPPPAAADLPPQAAPKVVAVDGDPGPLSPLLDRIRDAGIELKRLENDFGPLKLYLGETLLMQTDGRMASTVSQDVDAFDVVLFDAMLDPGSCPRIAIAPAEQASEEAVAAAVGLLQAAGFTVNRIVDVPGMVVARILAMVISEAADVALRGLATPQDVDRAMRLGAGYPLGPLAIGDNWGAAAVLDVLDHIRSATGDERARASMLLRRTALAKGLLLEE